MLVEPAHDASGAAPLRWRHAHRTIYDLAEGVMANTWMVRSNGGELIADFKKGDVAVGFGDTSDLSDATTAEAIRERYVQANPNERRAPFTTHWRCCGSFAS
jgi:hypothetical protein